MAVSIGGLRRRAAALALPVVLVLSGCGDDDGGGSAEGADAATICVGGEFSTRPDGLPGLEEAYGFKFPSGNVTALDEDALVYSEVDGGRCTFGSIFATDGRVAALGLTVLEDDLGFFPPFNGSLNVRAEVLEQYPQIEELFAPISEALDDETMVELNAQVDVEGNEPDTVARDWLDENIDLIPDDVDLSGASIRVGSKEFTEQLILGQLTKFVLEEAGANVSDQTGLVGSVTVRQALTSGEIDMYWEYLGTGWVTYLDNTEAIPDPQEQYEALKEADAANGIVWLEPAPFNNTYAIAMTNERSEELGITRISQIAELLQS